MFGEVSATVVVRRIWWVVAVGAAVLVAGCNSVDTTEPTAIAPAPPTVASTSTPVPATPTPTPVPPPQNSPSEFNVAAFAEINPYQPIRELDLEIDFGFDEYERIPRDAIEPIYSPKFVSPEEAALREDELVMGLSINGDSRAYPVGLLRAREMVNDEIGGTPLLVTW